MNEKGGGWDSTPIDFDLIPSISTWIELKAKTDSDCQGLKSQLL